MRILSRIAVLISVGGLFPGSACAEVLELSLQRADIASDFSGTEVLKLKLTPASREKFAGFSRRHVGEVIDLCVDGIVILSPRLVEPMTSGVITVGSFFSFHQVQDLAAQISRAGAKVLVVTQSP